MATKNQYRAPRDREASRIPAFQTIAEEAEFWDTHDTAEFEAEFEDVQDVTFVPGRRSDAITLQLDESTLAELTERARRDRVSPATLVRRWIAEHLRDPAGRST